MGRVNFSFKPTSGRTSKIGAKVANTNTWRPEYGGKFGAKAMTNKGSVKAPRGVVKSAFGAKPRRVFKGGMA